MEYQDYLTNPIKYRLFKTARLAVDLPCTSLKSGDYVSLRFVDDRPNKVYLGNPVEPYYAINEDVYLFGHQLENFTL